MLKVAVCDDSEIAIRELECHFKSLHSVSLDYEIFTGAKDLLNYLNLNIGSFDVYLLDIEMPHMNGIMLAKQIRNFDISALIIFQTVHASYVYDVFDLITFHYLQKPVSFEKLEEVLKRAEIYINKKKCRFHFTFAKEYFTISCKDILYFEQNLRKVMIYTKEGIYVSYMTAKEVMRQLDPTMFVELGASYIVNLEYVKVLTRNVAILCNEKNLPISRRNRKKVREKQLQYERNKM